MSNLWKTFTRTADKYCRYITVDNFNYSVNISLNYRYIFVETPKVGCSSIKLTLQKLELGDPSFSRKDFEDLHRRDFSPLLRPQQVGDLDAFLKREDLFRFCFVRNPYTRLLSCYLEKIVGNKHQKLQILQQLGFGQSDMNKEISFETFVDAVIHQPISMMDPHWRHQYYQTFQDSMQYDFIGKFEQFDADLNEVLHRITPDYTRYLSTEDRHSQDTAEALDKYYTPQLSEQVYRCFEKDFQYFEYPADLHGNG
jgi:dermatan 4-sulfotransferase 1